MGHLSKAFDVIDHEILLRKLNIYGIRGTAHDWFSYLSNRIQYVNFDVNISSTLPIKVGVPQGSILGPLLYLIYVNDIGNSCDGNMLSFADDTSLFLSHSNIGNYMNWLISKLMTYVNGFVLINYRSMPKQIYNYNKTSKHEM